MNMATVDTRDPEAREIEVVAPDFVDPNYISTTSSTPESRHGESVEATDNPYDYLPYSEHLHGDAPYTGKRIFDLALVLLIAGPAIALGTLCAIAVRLTSKGPVVVRAENVGMDGRSIEQLRFRTTITDESSEVDGAEQVTKIGWLLRRLSLDGLPQLLNVVAGTMSIVGPRSTPRFQANRYDARQRRGLSVRPGITGPVQLAKHQSLSWAQQIDVSVRYVETQSFATDLGIVARTVGTVLIGKNRRTDNNEGAIIDLRPTSAELINGDNEHSEAAAGELTSTMGPDNLMDLNAIDLDLFELEIIDLRTPECDLDGAKH